MTLAKEIEPAVPAEILEAQLIREAAAGRPERIGAGGDDFVPVEAVMDAMK